MNDPMDLVDRLVWAVDHLASRWPDQARQAWRIVTEARERVEEWHRGRLTVDLTDPHPHPHSEHHDADQGDRPPDRLIGRQGMVDPDDILDGHDNGR